MYKLHRTPTVLVLSVMHYATEDDDRRSIAAICLWNADMESAEFLVFMATTYRSAGRGGEEAYFNFSRLKPSIVTEEDKPPYMILALDLYRPKTHTLSNLSIYPDRNTCLFENKKMSQAKVEIKETRISVGIN